MKKKNCQECDDCGNGAAQVLPPQNTNNCPQQTPCPTAVNSACVFYRGEDIECGEDTVVEQGDTQEEINAKIIEYFCEKLADTPQPLISVTYSAALALLNAGNIIVNQRYFITDRNIFLTGLSARNYSVQGQRLMYILKEEVYEPTAPCIGVWYPTITVTTNDVVIWGGKVWTNTSGSTGSSDNEYELTALDYDLIPTTNTTYYELRSFEVEYDFLNDWVAVQKDWKGNRLGLSYENEQDINLGFNPVDISDWGSKYVMGNNAYGVYNNTWLVINNNIPGPIYENFVVIGNTNRGWIGRNSCPIIQNSNGDEISNNTCGGQIQYNTNAVYITNNSNTGSISSNSNNGTITNNRNFGNIINNSNNGIIEGNENNGDITNNSNNGRINNIGNTTTNITDNTNNGIITTTVVGTISDIVVDK